MGIPKSQTQLSDFHFHSVGHCAQPLSWGCGQMWDPRSSGGCLAGGCAVSWLIPAGGVEASFILKWTVFKLCHPLALCPLSSCLTILHTPASWCFKVVDQTVTLDGLIPSAKKWRFSSSPGSVACRPLTRVHLCLRGLATLSCRLGAGPLPFSQPLLDQLSELTEGYSSHLTCSETFPRMPVLDPEHSHVFFSLILFFLHCSTVAQCSFEGAHYFSSS